MYRSLAALSLASAVAGQQVGTVTTETHPSLPIQSCTAAGSCTTEQTKITLDANWRWTHTTTGYTNCYTGSSWNTTLVGTPLVSQNSTFKLSEECPDGVTCAQNCALDGADYSNTYGITTPSSGALKLGFVTNNSNGKNVGSRTYLLASDTQYRTFDLLNQEFTFDVDVSKLPCGLNGAVYFSEMDSDGGMARFPGNKAGAKYGTGYCDSQCPHDIKFINGEANVLGWNGTGANTGAGTYGSCCAEMDIWEANSLAAAYTPHPCTVNSQTRCENATACGDGDARTQGYCDKSGCDFNSYRMGDQSFYGPGETVDTTKPFTIVTQFITADGTSTGTLSEIRRFYVQGGVTIPNSVTSITGVTATNSITDNFCAQQKTAFGDDNDFKTKGGLAKMGQQLQKMVLVLSVWDDTSVYMNWLDSTYPPGASGPGVERGPCDPAAGVPATVEAAHPDASVIYSNIKVGAINSTFTA